MTTMNRMERLREHLEGHAEVPSIMPRDERPIDDRDRLRAMERRGYIKLGSGEVPNTYWEREPLDREPVHLLSALLDEREEGY